MDSQAGPPKRATIPPGALPSEITLPEPSGAHCTNQQVAQDENAQGCGQTLCCRGSERSPDPRDQGLNNLPQVTDTAPIVTNSTLKSSQSTNFPETGQKMELKHQTNESESNSEVTPTTEASHTRSDVQTKPVTGVTSCATEQSKSLVQESNEVEVVQEPSTTSLGSTTVQGMPIDEDISELVPQDETELDSLAKEPVSAANAESNVQSVCEGESSLVDSPKETGAQLSQEIGTDVATSQSTKSPREEELLWAPLKSSLLPLDPSVEQSIAKKMESNNYFKQLMEESEQLLMDSADLYEDDEAHSDLYESDQENADDDNLEVAAREELARDETNDNHLDELGSVKVATEEDNDDIGHLEDAAPEKVAKDNGKVLRSQEAATDKDNGNVAHLEDAASEKVATDKDYDEHSKHSTSEEVATAAEPTSVNVPFASEMESNVISCNPEQGASEQISTTPKEPEVLESKSESTGSDLGKSSKISNSLTSLSNVLSDGFKILQKIGYSAKPASQEDVNKETKDGEEGICAIGGKNSESVVEEQPGQMQSAMKQSGTNKEEVGFNSGESKNFEETSPSEIKKSPTEILEKSSHTISDSLADALNESFALLKRYGISKDKESAASKHKEKSKNSESISQEKAIIFNDNLYKNYNLMLKLQRDVAKLQIHLANMKDCVRAIDKDLEDLMDATMEDN